MSIVAVDPGTNGTGVAFHDGLDLYVWGLKGHGKKKFSRIITKYRAIGLPPVDRFVGEIPCVYPNSNADPNDLIPLAAVVGACAGATRAGTREFYEPGKWKGQISKEIHHPRIWRDLSKKDRAALEAEKPLYTKALWKDVMDAVGLLYWAVDNR